jgi:hypothetical protein
MHECAVAEQQVAPVPGLEVRGNGDDRFAAAERMLGQREFIGHTACQVEGVPDCSLEVGIGFHARAAGGRSEPGRVNRNNDPRAGDAVEADDDFFAIPILPKGFHIHSNLCNQGSVKLVAPRSPAARSRAPCVAP